MNLPLILSMSIQSTIQSVIVEIPIISSKPLIRQESKLIPKKVCRDLSSPTHSIQPQNHHSQRNYGNLGGMILGGVIGSMIGETDSQRRIGGVVGSIIGNKLTQPSYHSQQSQYPPINHTTHCYSSWSNEVVDVVSGYEVVYELDGKIHTKVLNYQPSSTIKIRKRIVVDGVIDNNNPQIYTPQELINPNLNYRQYNNDDYEILNEDELERIEEIEERKNYNHPYSKNYG